MQNDILINGKPLKVFLENQATETEKKEITEEILKAQKAHNLYHKPFQKCIELKGKKYPITFHSKRTIMNEQFELDLKQYKTVKERCLAILLMGKPVTTRDIKNYIRNRTGVTLKLSAVSPALSALKQGPLGEFITVTVRHAQHGGNTNQFKPDHDFKSVADALVWLKDQKAKLKQNRPAKSPGKKKDEPLQGQLEEIQGSFGLDNLVQKALDKGMALEIHIKLGKND